MLLSVIVPFYCRCSSPEEEQASLLRLARCIDSLCHCTNTADYEIVVVNDSAEHEDCQRLHRFLQTYSNKPLRLLHQPHRGAATSRNRGIDEARGRWLWMVDADDYVATGSIETLLNLLPRVPDEVDLVKLGAMTGREKRIEPEVFAEEKLHPQALLRPRSSCLDHTTYLYRRDFLQAHALRYPNEMALNEDSLFVLCCLQAATLAFAYPHLQLYIHTKQRQSITAGRWNEAQSRLFIDDCIQFFGEFYTVCQAGCREEAATLSTAEAQRITQQMRATYDRYLYVYCRVLAVKGCPWPMIADFRRLAALKETFYFLPHRADAKARCMANPFINRMLNLFCRLVRR